MAINDCLHLLITDSGLGGLAICGDIEKSYRRAGAPRDLRITYFNAWPDPSGGYNDLPDMRARARAFDRALACMDGFHPDRILIACNTLSILYGLTEHSRCAPVPVQGIIDAGIDLFCEALTSEPQASIVLLGTRTTIESQVHIDRLLHRGVRAERIAAISCHGLAGAIEDDPDSGVVADHITECAGRACRTNLPGTWLLAGLCCTHYGYVEDKIRAELARQSGKSVRTLDPNRRMATNAAVPGSAGRAGGTYGRITVQVISKIELPESKRRAIAGRLEAVSAATVHALMSYTHDPDLF